MYTYQILCISVIAKGGGGEASPPGRAYWAAMFYEMFYEIQYCPI